MFLVIITLILSLEYAYIGWRLGRLLPHPALRALLWLILACLALLPAISFLIRFSRYESDRTDALFWVSYLSFGILSLLATLLLMHQIGSPIIAWLLGWLPEKNFLRQNIASPERREFLTRSIDTALVVLTGGLGFYGYHKARSCFQVKNIRISIEDRHPDLHGLRIVQITDIHIGPTIKANIISLIVNKVNKLNPDIIAITGDLVDGSVRRLMDHVRPLGKLKATYGVYFVTGNHEYYSGVRSWMQALRGLGIDVLANEHRIINHKKAKFLIGGVHDYGAPKFPGENISDPELALRGGSHSDFKLLLAHQPRSAYAAAEAGFDLQISGHTHGGQFFPGNILVHLFQPFVRGLHKLKNMYVYVNTGTLYWGPPLRLGPGTAAEITCFELQATQS